MVELLGVLALISMVILLAFSVYFFSQKQLVRQTEDIDIQTNIRIAISTITKEIRSADAVTLNGNTLTIDSNQYQLDGNTLEKNNQAFVENIINFQVQKIGNQITLLLEGESPKSKKRIVRTTTIYLRE